MYAKLISNWSAPSESLMTFLACGKPGPWLLLQLQSLWQYRLQADERRGFVTNHRFKPLNLRSTHSLTHLRKSSPQQKLRKLNASIRRLYLQMRVGQPAGQPAGRCVIYRHSAQQQTDLLDSLVTAAVTSPAKISSAFVMPL